MLLFEGLPRVPAFQPWRGIPAARVMASPQGGTMRFIHRSLITIVLIVAVASLGASFGVTKTVRVVNVAFQPASISISQGDSIKWDFVSGDHSSTSGTCSPNCTPNGTWDSGVRSSGSFTRAFNSQGTFHYYCTVHGSMMQGTVTVGPPPPLSASATASKT